LAIVRDSSRIKVRIFFEVMGWPADGLTEHLKKVVNNLKRKWKITKENYAEPIPLDEKNPKVLTSHVEFEGVIPNIWDLFMFALMQGPSVVEIIEPSEIYLTAGEIQDILADIISKVQTMDREIKILSAKNKLLRDRLSELVPAESSENNEENTANKEVKL
jgi:hypothetical protein